MKSPMKKVTFRKQNLLNDKFDTGFDLIICRNVVIYFNDEAKERLYKAFYASLSDQGMLFIGATESLLAAVNIGFSRVTNCFYQKGGLAPASKRTAGLSRV